MVMVMRRNGVCSRSQSYLHGALCYDTVALLHSGEYLHTLAVALAERHLLLAVAFGVYLHVDEVDALLLGEGGEGQRDYIRAVLGYEVYLGVRALHYVAGVVELEDNGQVGVVHLCRTSVRLYVSAHLGDVVETLAVACAELGAAYLVEFVEAALGYLGTQVEVLVLCDDGEWLTGFYVVAAVDETLLNVAAARSRNHYSTLAARALHAVIRELGCFVFGFCHGEVLLAYYLVLDEYLGTGVVALGTLVVDAGTLHGVALGGLHAG